jgi:hypothetical protein
MLLALLAVLAPMLSAGIAVAGPAAAAQDPRAPQATVSRGPSCDPGGMEIQVTAGTAPYDVVLTTTRNPAGEDRAHLEPGTAVRLHTAPFDWGETVDPRLEYTAADGSGTSFVDELPDWSMTRPSREDCAAIGAPAAGSAPASSGAAEPTDTTTGSAPAPPTAAPATSAPAPPPTVGGSAAPPSPSVVVASGAAGGDGPASRAVGAGQPITVRASGFAPGEEVTVRFGSARAVLGRATAGPDGVAEVPVFVPAEASGSTQLDVVGTTSHVTAGVRLQVAAAHTVTVSRDRPLSWPALLALLSLVASGTGVVVVLGRRRAGDALGSG